MPDTVPNEAWPADAAVEALDGTTNTHTGLPYIAKGTNASSDPSYPVQYQRREQRQNAILAPWRQGQVVDEGSLDFGVYPIDYTLGGERKHFAGATAQAVADYSTKLVYLDDSNALQIQDSFPDDATTFLPLAKVTTDGGVMTIEDRRTWTVHAVPEFTGHIVGNDLCETLAEQHVGLELAVGEEFDDSIRVTVQAKDATGEDLAAYILMRGWLSDSDFGGEVGTAPDTGFTAHTGTVLKELTTDKHLLVLSSSSGEVVFDIQDTGAPTFYLMVELNGRVYSSGAFTFSS